MSDTLVLDSSTALDIVDTAVENGGIAVGDLDLLLGGVPGTVASLPSIAGAVVEHVTVNVLPAVELGGIGELVADLPGSVEHVLGFLPETVGGLLTGLGVHLDGTVDVLLDNTFGVAAALNPTLDPVAGLVNEITRTVGVTDELPARLSALAGLAIVGGDSVVTDLVSILDASFGLDLGPTVHDAVGTAGLTVDGMTTSLGLSHLGDLVTVGLTDAPVTAADTAGAGAAASHGLFDALLGDANDAGSGDHGNLGVAVGGLAEHVPTDAESAIGAILSSTVDTGAVTGTVTGGLTDVVGHAGVDGLLPDPASAPDGLGLGPDVDHTVSGLTDGLDHSVAGLGLALH